ncbi:glycoside hydrolase family 13 protein [Haloprofundus halobius]|uniref:glycoside hydrolase family 13 protein n=1 Tax=Haloprofundus halobius TaxID=2876194 RepID=UPI001CCE02EC|nr:alpha-glucosidase [Haloprofundus halobius]
MPETVAGESREWWKEAVFYQIYPRSFNDSDGDGVGDIPGIEEKVAYLDALGVDVVWLSPVYESPNADNGYDIADYRSIMDEFGTMDDWDRLRSTLHEQGIRLIMDLVVNHTSDQHDWFQRSRRREQGFEEYYHWRDGTPDEPPNNWESFFGGSAWSYDDEREAWYLHLFDENQPDLNWRNPTVRDEITSMVIWWLEKGIDGFRLDAINHLSKTEGYPDGDPEAAVVGATHFTHGPRIEEYLRELHDEAFANYDAVTVAEMGGTSVGEALDYLGEDGVGLDMIFQFDHLSVDEGPDGRWDVNASTDWRLTEFKEIIDSRQEALDGVGWDPLFLGNHDYPRPLSRFGDERYRTASAKLLATFCLTMRGTPFIYQGEEIGMTNAEFETFDEIDDPMTVGTVEELLSAGTVDSFEDVRELVNYWSRDHSRTPMQWSDGSEAGFTTGEPWLGVNDDYERVNVEAARADANSIWEFYRRLVELRNEHDVLVYGEYEPLLPDDDQLYAFTRTLDDEAMLVVLNWSAEVARFESPTTERAVTRTLLANYDDAPTDPYGETFRPYEAVVYRE